MMGRFFHPMLWWSYCAVIEWSKNGVTKIDTTAEGLHQNEWIGIFGYLRSLD